jgi:hypothetical protein
VRLSPAPHIVKKTESPGGFASRAFFLKIERFEFSFVARKLKTADSGGSFLLYIGPKPPIS